MAFVNKSITLMGQKSIYIEKKQINKALFTIGLGHVY